jgi:hypothetical protein
MADQYSQDGEPLDIFGSDPFGRNYLYGLSGNGDGQGLAPYGTRYAENLSQPTTAKRGGYYGNIGTINDPMTEFSSAFEVDGRTVQYPLIVPTLTVDELQLLRSTGQATPEIDQKAQQFALNRLSRGQDPFATTQELRYPQPQGLNPAPITGEIRETPRSPILGLFSDLVNLPLQYMSSPERTQQSQGAAQFLYGTGIPKTLERMSYGDSLFSGAGGLGGTTRMRPETAEALLNVAPFAPVAGRVAGRMIKATEGMPVGMSIKDVGKSSITREGNPIQGAVVLVGDKIFMGRTHGDALNRAVYEGAVRKEGGKYIYPKGAEVNSDLFMTKDGQIIDRLQASKMFDIGASETAIEKGLMQNNPPKSMTVDSYIEQATALKKQMEQSPYPQQAALDLAQQRAALPVEQGGLGLPANNTAADRAAAQGGKDMVHFSRSGGDYTTLDSGQYAIAPFDAVGTHVGTPKTAMERFQNTVGYKVNNPNYTNDELRGATYPVTILGDRPLMNQNGMPWGEDDLNAFLRKEGGHNWSDIQGGKMTYQDMNAALRKKLFEEQGYTSIPYFNEVEGKGSISYIVPPENIRSRFAAFDPFRKDVATATAMGVALPDLLAQPVNQVQPTYETIPMYTDPFGNTIGSSIR